MLNVVADPRIPLAALAGACLAFFVAERAVLGCICMAAVALIMFIAAYFEERVMDNGLTQKQMLAQPFNMDSVPQQEQDPREKQWDEKWNSKQLQHVLTTFQDDSLLRDCDPKSVFDGVWALN